VRSSSTRAMRRRTSGTRFLLSTKGAMGESLVEGHTAVELDPGSVSARRTLGIAYCYAADTTRRGITSSARSR
jgi:hypothetical protein